MNFKVVKIYSKVLCCSIKVANSSCKAVKINVKGVWSKIKAALFYNKNIAFNIKLGLPCKD